MSDLPARPISPVELKKHLAGGGTIPPPVFTVVNALLVKRGGTGGTIIIKQAEVLAALEMALGDAFSRDVVFDEGWLDFEEAYRGMGWKVDYDKPGYGETYGAYWVFTPKGK